MKSINLTSGVIVGWIDLYRFLRRHLGAIAVLLTGAVLINWSSAIAEKFSSEEWDLGNFYAAIFDWSSILCAFLFGVYVYVLGKGKPFIEAISDTDAFRKFRSYVRRTIYMMLATSAVLIPQLVAPILPSDGTWNDWGFWLFAVVVAWSMLLYFRFFKIVRTFHKLERTN